MSKPTQVRNAGKPFTKAAVNFIFSNAGKMTSKKIAARLGRTVKSVSRKAEKLSLSLSVR